MNQTEREMTTEFMKMDKAELAKLAATVMVRCVELEEALRRFVAYNDPAKYVNDQGSLNELMSNFVRDFPIPVEALRGAAFNWIPKMSAEKAANGRIERDSDGKQAAKMDVREWWDRWQGQQSLYPSKAEFARVMLDKHPTLKTPVTIGRWCKQWEKEGTQRA